MNAILGGAFDPPHAGHVAMARAVLDQGLADTVSLMPCYKHNFDKKMTTPKHRLAMCRLCEQKGITVDPFEINTRLGGGTLALVEALGIEEHGDKRPTFIIGADNAECFGEWVRHDELLLRARFIVVPREGTEISHHIKSMFKTPHVILEKGVVTVSSTQVRFNISNWWTRRVDGWENPERLMPWGVFDYIIEHGLYKVMPQD